MHESLAVKVEAIIRLKYICMNVMNSARLHLTPGTNGTNDLNLIDINDDNKKDIKLNVFVRLLSLIIIWYIPYARRKQS